MAYLQCVKGKNTVITFCCFFSKEEQEVKLNPKSKTLLFYGFHNKQLKYRLSGLIQGTAEHLKEHFSTLSDHSKCNLAHPFLQCFF